MSRELSALNKELALETKWDEKRKKDIQIETAEKIAQTNRFLDFVASAVKVGGEVAKNKAADAEIDQQAQDQGFEKVETKVEGKPFQTEVSYVKEVDGNQISVSRSQFSSLQESSLMTNRSMSEIYSKGDPFSNETPLAKNQRQLQMLNTLLETGNLFASTTGQDTSQIVSNTPIVTQDQIKTRIGGPNADLYEAIDFDNVEIDKSSAINFLNEPLIDAWDIAENYGGTVDYTTDSGEVIQVNPLEAQILDKYKSESDLETGIEFTKYLKGIKGPTAYGGR